MLISPIVWLAGGEMQSALLFRQQHPVKLAKPPPTQIVFGRSTRMRFLIDSYSSRRQRFADHHVQYTHDDAEFGPAIPVLLTVYRRTHSISDHQHSHLSSVRPLYRHPRLETTGFINWVYLVRGSYCF